VVEQEMEGLAKLQVQFKVKFVISGQSPSIRMPLWQLVNSESEMTEEDELLK